jgi:uncharacterized protein with predicted RNA binding PUA domain
MENIKRSLDIRRVKAISDYQFGPEITEILFSNEDLFSFKHSNNTGKLKYIHKGDDFFLSLRPTNGYFTLSFIAARQILENTSRPRMRVIVLDEISKYIREGRNVFCKHVVQIDENLRPMDEVIVINESGNLLAIGRLSIPVEAVKDFKRGVAVNVRKGNH